MNPTPLRRLAPFAVLLFLACGPAAPPDGSGTGGGTAGGMEAAGGGAAGGSAAGGAAGGGAAGGSAGGQAGGGAGGGAEEVDAGWPDAGPPDSGSPDAGLPDTTPPELLDRVPFAGATNVSTGTSLVFRFDEPIDRASASVSITPQVALGAAAFSDSDTTVTFTPASALSTSTSYTVTVAARDLAGNSLTANTTASFTTAAPPDVTPPSVYATVPAANATGVALVNFTVTVTFSESMNPASLQLSAPGRDIVFSTPVMSSNDTVAEWSMNTNAAGMPVVLDPSTTYALRLDGTDLSNNAMPQLNFSFTTQAQPDSTPPRVLGFTPADGSSMVPRNARLTVVFSEPMNPASVQSALRIDGAAPAGTFAWSSGNAAVTFTPAAQLTVANHSVSIGVAATDATGNNLPAFTSSFTVINVVDTTAPALVSSSPVSGAVNVWTQSCAANPVTETVSLTFSEALERSSVEQSLRVMSGTTVIAGAVTFEAMDSTVRFRPQAPLPNGATISVTLGSPTGVAVSDLAGNALPPTTVTFTTIARRELTLLGDASSSGYVANTPAAGPQVNLNAALTVGELLDATASARGFIGFPQTTQLSSASCIRSAVLTVEQTGTSGTPYGSGNLGDVLLETVNIGAALDATDFNTAPFPFPLAVVLSSGPAVHSNGNTRAGLRIVPVTPMARAVYGLANPSTIRWRLRFTNVVDVDGTVQKAQFAAPPGTSVEPTPALHIVHDTP